MGDCQNYGPFLGPYYNTGPNTGPNLGDPKRDHNFDSHPYAGLISQHPLKEQGTFSAILPTLGQVLLTWWPLHENPKAMQQQAVCVCVWLCLAQIITV